MKRILITGANSYIGTSFEKWMQQFDREYQIDTIDMHGEDWKKKDFSAYDSIFHVAGIAHADISKISDEKRNLYYEVNCELAVETASKYANDLADKNGQFIYMSSIIVYGDGGSVLNKRIITKDTPPNPSNFYGDSKLKAENRLSELQQNLNICILRPPMIYGESSKGNYETLKKIALNFPIFPDFKNERSMLSIDNLCLFLKDIIDEDKAGIFFPQNETVVRTSYLVRDIAEKHNRKVYLLPYMSWLIILLSFFPGKVGKIVNKAFSSIVYSDSEVKK